MQWGRGTPSVEALPRPIGRYLEYFGQRFTFLPFFSLTLLYFTQ
jgi:hypothetical protein